MEIWKYSDILAVSPHSLKCTHFIISVVDSDSLISSLSSGHVFTSKNCELYRLCLESRKMHVSYKVNIAWLKTTEEMEVEVASLNLNCGNLLAIITSEWIGHILFILLRRIPWAVWKVSKGDILSNESSHVIGSIQPKI